MSRDHFIKTSTEPTYKDVETLRRFITSRGKIVSREKSGLSAMNQRKLAKQIKWARYLGLIPYIAYQTEKLKQKIRTS
jgi:small subunit ribosomal protein S18